MDMEHAADPRAHLLADLGDISGFELFNSQVLVAVYIRPNKTRSGIYLPDQTTDEDRYQGKVGLIVATGPTAFDPAAEGWFKDLDIRHHEWVVFKPSDGWSVTINGVLCRILSDTAVKARLDQPDKVW